MERYENIPEEGTYPEGEDPLLQRVRQVAMGHFAVLGRVFPMEEEEGIVNSHIMDGEDAYGDLFSLRTILDGTCGRRSFEGLFQAGEYACEEGGLRDIIWYIQSPMKGDGSALNAQFHEGDAVAGVYEEKNPKAWPLRRFFNRWRGKGGEFILRAWEHQANGSIRRFRREYDRPQGEAPKKLYEALGHVVDTLEFLKAQQEEGLLGVGSFTRDLSDMDFTEWRKLWQNDQ